MTDPYSQPSPYDVLGVKPDATAAEIRDRKTKLDRDNQESGASASERAKRKQELDAAYDQLRVAEKRVRVDFWLLDPRIGQKQCERLAENLATPNTDVEGLIKPRMIRVTHVTVLPELGRLVREPQKVAGLHPRMIDVDERASLPAALELQFDC